MSAYSDQVKNYVERYRAEYGDEALLDPHAIAEWAFGRGLHKPNPRAIIDIIAADIAQVFREEYRTTKDGRRYRAMHARTIRRGNESFALWGDMDDPNVPHSHFVISFGQRRQNIVGDCVRLQTDVDVYNEKRQPAEPIQMIMDFTLDVAELVQRPRRAA